MSSPKGGRPAYRRERHLQGLIPVTQEETADTSRAARIHIVALLRRALRAERVRGRSGHWAYDLNRHMSLLQALKAEQAGLGLGLGTTQTGDKSYRADALFIR
jgi:hypothetical protein